jgi:hypothetical protein
VDLVAFRYVASDDGGNSYRDSHNDTYVSLSDKANAEARKLSGVNTAPTTAPGFEFFGDIGKWKEETKAEAEKRVTFLVDGMDKWYSQSTTYYATESLKEGVDAEEAIMDMNEHFDSPLSNCVNMNLNAVADMAYRQYNGLQFDLDTHSDHAIGVRK